MSDEVRANEIYARVMQGNQSFNLILSVGIRGLLQLLQHLSRMENEKLLAGGEVESFEKYMRATEGKFDIMNIPIPEESPEKAEGLTNAETLTQIGSLTQTESPAKNESLTSFRKALDERRIRYHILPDLDEKDHRLQICIYQPDLERFSGCYMDYIKNQLKGGELARENLLNLTQGRVTFVSIPGEDRVEEFKKDFDNLRINYAILPDLKVGDGQVQLLVANDDIPTMREWYQLYRADLLKAGQAIPKFTAMTPEEYQATGRMKAQDYIDTSSQPLQDKLCKYESHTKGAFEEAVDRLENSIDDADTYAFQTYLRDQSYEMLSVDHDSLVAGIARSQFPQEIQETFFCRIPGTYGEDTRYLSLPKDQVFEMQNGSRIHYYAFTKAEEEPLILNKWGKKTSDYATGHALMEHFDQVKEARKIGKLEKMAEMATQLSNDIPLPNPVLSK